LLRAMGMPAMLERLRLLAANDTET
jgi:hypothetical protein